MPEASFHSDTSQKMDITLLDIKAYLGWSSTFVIIYTCSYVGYYLAGLLKLESTSILLGGGGFVVGIAIIAGIDLPPENIVDWTGQYAMAFEIYFSSWWLAIIVLLGWYILFFSIYLKFIKKIKLDNQGEN